MYLTSDMTGGVFQTMLQVLAGGVGLYGLLVAAIFLGQRAMMYPAGGTLGTPAEAGWPEAHEIKVETEDGLRLVSWYLAPAPGHPVVVYFHGNAGTLADRAFKARLFSEAGFGVLLAEYRGYGGNPGKPTEAGLYADARANLAWLEAAGHGPDKTIVYGESLGTGVAVQAAMEMARAGAPAAGLVLEAPFSSMAAAAQVHYPWLPAARLTRDRYDSEAKIAEVKAPLLVVHGSNDRVVPQAQGRRLFDRAADPKEAEWIVGGGHADLYDFEVGRSVVSFIERITRK